MPNVKLFYILSAKTGTALHIGTQEQPNDVSDSLFRRDSQGRLLVPGTGIAGALRGHLTRLAPALTALTAQKRKLVCDALTGKPTKTDQACGCIVCHLFGDIRPTSSFRDENQALANYERENGRASRLIVHDAVIENSITHIRDGVGIDRTTGTAARSASAKFDFETIPAEIPFTIQLELEEADEIDEYLLQLALDEWQQERIRFGGSKSRGAGSVRLSDVQVMRLDLGQPHDLMKFLRRDQQTPPTQLMTITPPHRQYHHEYAEVPGSVQSWLTFEFKLAAQGFFLTNDPTRAAAQGYDHLSLQFLPGASLRGALRSQAERIARTLVNLRVNSESEFLELCPASNPFVTSTKQRGLMSSAARIRQSDNITRREDADAYDLAEQLFGSADWGSRLWVDDAPIINNPLSKKLDFVAIDRFTGGAADGAKFDAYALWKPRFKCRMHLEAPRGWEVGWLLYVLRDLTDGLVPVGFGAAKGFGVVNLEELRLTLGYTYPEAAPLAGLLARDTTFYHQHTFDGWTAVEKTNWFAQWNEKLTKYQVAVAHQDSHDPYWDEHTNDNGKRLHILYRKETSPNDYP